MPDNRPWYKKRRNWGIALGTIAAGISVLPGITSKVIGAGLGFIASNVFSYGLGKAVERNK